MSRIPNEVPDDVADRRNRALLECGPNAGDTDVDRRVRAFMVAERMRATGDGRWVDCSCGIAGCANATYGRRCRGRS